MPATGAIVLGGVAGIDLRGAAPDHWQDVHRRIAADIDPHSHSVPCHRADLPRRELSR